MKIKALLLSFFILCSTATAREVVHLFLDGPIHAVTVEYVIRGIEDAIQRKAEAVILQIQTPGGMEESMRNIISRMINSPVPVIVFVAPTGSRATSAGFFITIASDIAVMAPGTHLGSAHPVFGADVPDSENTKTMMKKATEDSVAYIKTLAQQRGRNMEAAEKAVRESVSFTETEALQNGLINFIARDIKEVLEKADGMEYRKRDGGLARLALKDAKVIPFEMTRRERFLSILADPAVAFLLLSIAMMGLLIEFKNPGLIVPGVIGVICFALFLFSIDILPLNYAGVLLIVLAVILFILELKIQSYGLLTLGGIICLVAGGMMMIDAPIPEMKVPIRAIATVAILMAGTMSVLLVLVISLHRKKPLTGVQGLMQEIGVAQTDIDPEGQVFVHGELWQAISPQKILKGEKVRIVSVDGLTLHVERYRDENQLFTA